MSLWLSGVYTFEDFGGSSEDGWEIWWKFLWNCRKKKKPGSFIIKNCHRETAMTLSQTRILSWITTKWKKKWLSPIIIIIIYIYIHTITIYVKFWKDSQSQKLMKSTWMTTKEKWNLESHLGDILRRG